MRKHKILGQIMIVFFLVGSMAHIAWTAEDEVKLKTIQELVKEAQDGVNFITIDTMKKSIQENDKLVLLDVRTEREYQAAHIKGATWLERGIAEFVLARTLPIQDAEIIVYCKGGNRTGLVVKALTRAGYTNVVGLEGGFDAWANQGNPVYNFLGEFKATDLAVIKGGTLKMNYYEDKK